jgi:hypothetical protein
MESIIVIPKKLYKLIVPGHNVTVILSIEQSYKELVPYLSENGLCDTQIRGYVETASQGFKANARTTAFIQEGVIVIKMNYFDNSISRIAILVHEIIHCSKRICDIYEMQQNASLGNREEAECYLSEYIFEDVMSLLRPSIDYEKDSRNMGWFYEITHVIQ